MTRSRKGLTRSGLEWENRGHRRGSIPHPEEERMCEECVKKGIMQEGAQAGPVSPEKFAEILEQMKEDTLPLDYKGILKSLSPERTEQEQELHKRAFGADLTEIWEAFERMREGTAPPDGRITIALAKWITVNLRSKAEAFATAARQMDQLQALMAVMRMAGVIQEERQEPLKKETLH